jgi:hypothetical protein
MSGTVMVGVGLAAFVGAMVAAGCSSGPATPATETYTSEILGFSVTFPTDWSKSTGGYGMDLALMPPGQTDVTVFRDLVFVRAEALAEPMPLDDFFAVKMARGAKAMPGYAQIEKGPVKLNGQDARRAVWSYTHGDVPVMTMAYFLVSGGRGYMIAGSAHVDRFAQRKPGFDQVMATFKVTGVPAAAPGGAPAGPAK